jgi:hypothetical protein
VDAGKKYTHVYYACNGCQNRFSIIKKHSSPTNLVNHLKFSRCQNKDHIAQYNEALEGKKRKEAAEGLTAKDIEVIIPQQKQAKLSAFMHSVHAST